MAAERGETRKFFDKVGYAASFAEVPLDAAGAGVALISGALLPAIVLGGLGISAFIRNREHGKPPEQQSIFNSERIMDRLGLGTKGSNKLNTASTRLALAAA